MSRTDKCLFRFIVSCHTIFFKKYFKELGIKSSFVWQFIKKQLFLLPELTVETKHNFFVNNRLNNLMTRE